MALLFAAPLRLLKVGMGVLLRSIVLLPGTRRAVRRYMFVVTTLALSLHAHGGFALAWL